MSISVYLLTISMFHWLPSKYRVARGSRRSIFLTSVYILAICDDIHTNHGPSTLCPISLFTYNIRSLLSNDHTSALNDLMETYHPNIISLTETWINKSSTRLIKLTQIHLVTSYSKVPFVLYKNTSLKKLWVAEIGSSCLTQFL